MAAATAVKVRTFTNALMNKKINLETDTFKLLASNIAPNVAHAVKTDLTEIATGNGYSAGGPTVPNPTVTQLLGKGTFDGDDVTITASGGSIAAFRYLWLYSDTAASKDLVCYFDLGASQTLTTGQVLTLNINASGILSIE